MGGWLTNWRTLIPQKSSHWSEGSEPQVRLHNLGVQQLEEEFLENQTLKASRISLQDFNRTGGNRDSILGGHTQSSVCIRTQGKEQWPHKRLNQTYLLVLEGLLQRQGGGCGSPWGQGHWQQKFWEVLFGVRPPKSTMSHNKEPGTLQCWVASGQTANREGTQPHLSADKQIKVLLSSAHQGNTKLYPPPVPPIRKLLDSLIYQRADSRSKKNYNPADCRTKTTLTER